MSPCYNCTERSEACHSVCERYKAYRNELEEAKKLKPDKSFDRYQDDKILKLLTYKRKRKR